MAQPTSSDGMLLVASEYSKRGNLALLSRMWGGGFLKKKKPAWQLPTGLTTGENRGYLRVEELLWRTYDFVCFPSSYRGCPRGFAFNRFP